jgi:hypothetical protein
MPAPVANPIYSVARAVGVIVGMIARETRP